MPLKKAWRSLERSTVGRAPDRYGLYELGDEDGTVLEVGTGVLQDELKTALAYGNAAKVRWEATQTRDQANELAKEHRKRLGDP